jgi:hypothetical protein
MEVEEERRVLEERRERNMNVRENQTDTFP